MSECRAVEVVIPEAETGKAEALADLASSLAELPESGFAEIWVSHGSFPTLCALINGDRGWLMFLRYEGDAGFSSRNPDYAPSHAELEFMLSNGQVDRYPAEWTYSRAQILETLEYFAHTRHLPAALYWFNDSGDGAKLPDEDQTRQR